MTRLRTRLGTVAIRTLDRIGCPSAYIRLFVCWLPLILSRSAGAQESTAQTSALAARPTIDTTTDREFLQRCLESLRGGVTIGPVDPQPDPQPDQPEQRREYELSRLRLERLNGLAEGDSKLALAARGLKAENAQMRRSLSSAGSASAELARRLTGKAPEWPNRIAEALEPIAFVEKELDRQAIAIKAAAGTIAEGFSRWGAVLSTLKTAASKARLVLASPGSERDALELLLNRLISEAGHPPVYTLTTAQVDQIKKALRPDGSGAAVAAPIPPLPDADASYEILRVRQAIAAYQYLVNALPGAVRESPDPSDVLRRTLDAISRTFRHRAGRKEAYERALKALRGAGENRGEGG